MGRHGLIALLTFSFATVALGQDHSAAIQALPSASQSAVVTENVWTSFPTIDIADGRVDEKIGILRAAYRLNPVMSPKASPEATVRSWLLMDGKEFGIHTPNALELVSEQTTSGARHLTFQQTLEGVRVYGSFMHVNLNQAGLPVMATSSYAPHLEEIDSFNPVPVVSTVEAEFISQQAISATGATSDSPELLVLPDSPPRLIWRTVVWPDSIPGEWEVLLDASTGALIQLMNQRIFSHDHSPSKVDGEGHVWLFDPLTASGQSYGGAFIDNNDQDNSSLTGILQSVTLRDIQRTSNGSYRLNGPWIRIIGSSAPIESDPSNFKYTRADQHFESVMVYYFIDENQRYIQSLNVGNSPPSQPVEADPRAFPEDNSYYVPARNSLHFGTGGADDAEDAGVIIHEYGHAMMYHHAPSIGGLNNEQSVLSEGFADYWAVSYRRHLMDSGQVPQGDWRDVFPWDGVAWGGRRAEGNYSYDVIRRACRRNCNFYYYGQTWSALMMELWEQIGRENTDRLHLAAFAYIGFNFTLRDMAEALLQANDALYNGQYSAIINAIFIPLNFLAAEPGVPTITHVPLSRIYDLSNPVRFEADIEVIGFTVTNAEVYYRLDSGDFQTLELRQVGRIRWARETLLPESATLLEYYIQATSNTATVTLPKSAPEDLWSVELGADTEAPTITHTPITHISPERALLPFTVEVTDNYKLSQVLLEYSVTNSIDQTTRHGSIPLTDAGDGTFTFSLPETGTNGNSWMGTWMEYRIVADDATNPPNQTIFPSPQQPSIRLDVLPGLNELGIWNPGEWLRLATGEWGAVESAFGHNGDIWLTAPDGSYSDLPSTSVLSFPDVNVAGYPDALLEFWHWYDFEHIGVPGPGEDGGMIYDGGQIQLSTDGGQSWTIALPQWGYNGEVNASPFNPLSGSPAFGGSSFGWRRVRVPLPDAPEGAYRSEVRARLVLGTGAGNSNSTTDTYAGWAVRDARVFINAPVDRTSPEILFAPHTHQFIPPGSSTLPIQIAATDHPGIESVRLHLYDIQGTQLIPLGVFRFRPHQSTPNWFETSAPVQEVKDGSTLGYYITVQDFDQNTRMLGEELPDELLKLYVPTEAPLPALLSGRLTGAWINQDEGIYADTDTRDEQSSVVLAPVYFSTNSQRTMLRLRHSYDFSGGSNGQVSVTVDGGTNWEILGPDQTPPDQEIGLIPKFSGMTPEFIDSWFDLSSLSQPYQLRLDLVHGAQKIPDGFWEIQTAEYYRLAEETPIPTIAENLILYPNFPNPFSEETTINFVLPQPSHVRIMLFNMIGQTVQTILDQRHEAGGYAVHLNMRGLAPGVYWIRMETDDEVLQQPITLIQ